VSTPYDRPRLSRAEALHFIPFDLLGAASSSHPVLLLGLRGYYKNSMGQPGKNDRGIYDDAIFLISPDAFVSFNANCDPSIYRKGIATLAAGTWWYRLGIHGLSKPKPLQYEALVQAGPVRVERDGQTQPELGFFGINIHRGGQSGTSSLGCQTIPPAQWPSFISLVKSELARHRQKKLPYVLQPA
jgi:lysozyme